MADDDRAARDAEFRARHLEQKREINELIAKCDAMLAEHRAWAEQDRLLWPAPLPPETGDLVRMIGVDPRVTPDLRTCLYCVTHEGRDEGHPALHHVVRDVWQCPRCRRVYVLGESPPAEAHGPAT